MAFTVRQRVVMETNLARDHAETLLNELLDASRAVQIHNIVKAHPILNCGDSLDRAIASTRRVLDALNRSLDQAEADLRSSAYGLLDEFADDVEGDMRTFDLHEDHDVILDDPLILELEQALAELPESQPVAPERSSALHEREPAPQSEPRSDDRRRSPARPDGATGGID